MNSSSSHRTLVLLIGALGIASPVVAQDESTVTLSGVAEDQCVLGEAEAGDGAIENFDTPSGAVFTISQLTDPSTLTTRAAELSLALGAMCNGPHRLVVESQNAGLWRNEFSGVTSGFGSAVPYRLGLVWAEQNRDFSAEAASRQSIEWEVLIGRPAFGDVELTFMIDAGATNAGTGAPLLSGSYSDVVTVTVESQ